MISRMSEPDVPRCSECGEQILSRRLGHCPACQAELPEGLRLDGEAKERIESEYRKALEAAREVDRRQGFDGEKIIGA
jgi:predicted amidophosphoribosyltransferase